VTNQLATFANLPDQSKTIKTQQKRVKERQGAQAIADGLELYRNSLVTHGMTKG
jgi:hypothetical protein